MHGFTLLEVLVSLLLLACMLLGLDALQIQSLHETKATFYVGIANQQLTNMAAYLAMTHKNPAVSVIQHWQLQNQDMLPSAESAVDHQKIIITWGNIKTCKEITLGESGCLIINIKE